MHKCTLIGILGIRYFHSLYFLLGKDTRFGRISGMRELGERVMRYQMMIKLELCIRCFNILSNNVNRIFDEKLKYVSTLLKW